MGNLNKTKYPGFGIFARKYFVHYFVLCIFEDYFLKMVVCTRKRLTDCFIDRQELYFFTTIWVNKNNLLYYKKLIICNCSLFYIFKQLLRLIYISFLYWKNCNPKWNFEKVYYKNPYVSFQNQKLIKISIKYFFFTYEEKI